MYLSGKKPKQSIRLLRAIKQNNADGYNSYDDSDIAHLKLMKKDISGHLSENNDSDSEEQDIKEDLSGNPLSNPLGNTAKHCLGGNYMKLSIVEDKYNTIAEETGEILKKIHKIDKFMKSNQSEHQKLSDEIKLLCRFLLDLDKIGVTVDVLINKMKQEYGDENISCNNLKKLLNKYRTSVDSDNSDSENTNSRSISERSSNESDSDNTSEWSDSDNDISKKSIRGYCSVKKWFIYVLLYRLDNKTYIKKYDA